MSTRDLQEISTGTEALQKRPFDKIVLGHYARDFDRDQWLCRLLAIKVGLVEATTPMEFRGNISPEELRDQKTLFIEGFHFDKLSTNKTESNAYTNDPKTDAPAAVVLAQAHQRKLHTLPDKDKLKDLLMWIKSIEAGGKDYQPNVIDKSDLDILTQIFHAVKHDTQSKTPDASKLIEATDEIFIRLFTADRLPMAEIYAKQLVILQRHQNEKLNILRQHANEHVFSSTTQTGLVLRKLDVSGLDNDTGAFGAMGRSDLAVLIDNQKDDAGNILGKQIKIQSRRPDIDLIDLASRLNISERLFGGGYNLTMKAGFDGHPTIIGSPRTGSHLDPENVWQALQKHFDFSPKNQEEFTSICVNFARAFGCENFTVQDCQSPEDEYTISKRKFILNLKNQDGTSRIIALSESDLDLYGKCLTGDMDKDRRMLLEQTGITEPRIVSDLRERQSIHALTQAIIDNNPQRALSIVDDINPATIDGLDPILLLHLFSQISHDNTSILQVWDKDNLRFRTINQTLPDWIANDINALKIARYSFNTALQKKIDGIALHNLCRYAQTSDEKTKGQVIDILTRIANSEPYQASHRDKTVDRLTFQLNKLHQGEPIENSLENLADCNITPATREKITQSIQSQTDLGTTPILTLLAEVGRPIEDRLARDGIARHTGFLESSVTPVAKIRLEGLLRLGANEADSKNLVDAIISQVLRISNIDQTNTPIRIVAGGFPAPTMFSLGMEIQKLCQQKPALSNRLLLTHFDQQNQKFYDVPVSS